MKILYLIDFSCYCYKFSAVYKVTRKLGGIDYDISVPFGFIRSLKSNPFKDIVICLDAAPRINTNYIPSYKGQRLKEPNESMKFPRVELVKMLTQIGGEIGKNIKVVASEGQESDQVIASITYKVSGLVDDFQSMASSMISKQVREDSYLKRFSEGMEEKILRLGSFDAVCIGTTDSDMYQLTHLPNVMVDQSTSGKSLNMGEMTPKAVKGIVPGAIVAYKAIMGDKSDNVPSLPLGLKDTELINNINKELNSPSKFHSFVKDLQLGVEFNSRFLSELANRIRATNTVSQLITNNKVTELTYISDPHIIEYPSYNIKETLIKYGLKI